MSRGEHIHKLAEWSGKAESPAMHKILERAMTDEEARFLLDLPAATADLAAKYGMDEKAVEEKVLNLARRGLVVPSRKGIRYPRNPSTLHDNILSSAEEEIPAEMGRLWMDLYDGEGWGEEIGRGMAAFGITALRTIPSLNSIPSGVQLLPHESIEAIIVSMRGGVAPDASGVNSTTDDHLLHRRAGSLGPVKCWAAIVNTDAAVPWSRVSSVGP